MVTKCGQACTFAGVFDARPDQRGIKIITAIHEDIQDVYDDLGQRGAFDDMLSWDEDTFFTVAEDFELELEGVE